jgi:hypothetical protein
VTSSPRGVAGVWVVALVLVGIASACGGPGASQAASPTNGSGDSGSAATDACPSIDLRTPAGEPIDLSGTWVTELEGTRAGIYYFQQVGSCVWFAGAFPHPSETDVPVPLGYLTVVFRGEVGSDFRIVGDWVDAREQGLGQPGASGSMELSLEVTESGELRLTYIGGQGQPFLEPGYREEQSWIKISDGGAYPPST